MIWGDDSLKLTPAVERFIKKSSLVTRNIIRDDPGAAEIMGKLSFVLLEIKGEELALEILKHFCDKAAKNGVAGTRLTKSHDEYCSGNLGYLYRIVVEEDSGLRDFILRK
jgi:hypothetical protein